MVYKNVTQEFCWDRNRWGGGEKVKTEVNLDCTQGGTFSEFFEAFYKSLFDMYLLCI